MQNSRYELQQFHVIVTLAADLRGTHWLSKYQYGEGAKNSSP